MIERTCPDCHGCGTFYHLAGDYYEPKIEQVTCGCSNGTISVCEDDTPIPSVKKKGPTGTMDKVIKEFLSSLS